MAILPHPFKPPKRATIYLNQSIQAAFEGCTPEEGLNRSERLGIVCASYLAMVGAALPDLSNEDWVSILNAYSGAGIGMDPALEARMLHAVLEDDDTTSPELIQKIRSLNLPSRFAVLEVIHRHHAMPSGEFLLEALIDGVRGKSGRKGR